MPGEHLLEAEIASMLEVSRGPVRQALAQLEHEGLVITRRNRGSTVARLSQEDAEELKSLRLALERLAMQEAIRRATEDDLAAMEAIVGELETALGGNLTIQDIAAFDIRFHDQFYRAAHHKRLYRCWTSLCSQVQIFLLSRFVDLPRARQFVLKTHRAILAALRSRNEATAVPVIESHVRGLSGVLAETQGAPDNVGQT